MDIQDVNNHRECTTRFRVGVYHPPRVPPPGSNGLIEKDRVIQRHLRHPSSKGAGPLEVYPAAWPWGEGETASRSGQFLLSTPGPFGPEAVAGDHDLRGAVGHAIERG